MAFRGESRASVRPSAATPHVDPVLARPIGPEIVAAEAVGCGPENMPSRRAGVVFRTNAFRAQ